MGNRVQRVIATATNHPTAADCCRQCGMSTDVEGVANVHRNVLLSAVTETLYEGCNSEFSLGGRTVATVAVVEWLLWAGTCCYRLLQRRFTSVATRNFRNVGPQPRQQPSRASPSTL
jgi:hypothetical protein